MRPIPLAIRCGQRTPSRQPAAVPLDRYRAAVARLDALIDPEPLERSRDQAALRERATVRLIRLRHFLAYLGNPQDDYPIVHVGGTSGKGSTSTAIAAILTAAGYRVGLHTSPYLQVATEKLQLDGRLIAADDFAALVDDVLAAVEPWHLAGGAPALTYGEFWVAMTLLWFARKRVDLGVIEVGAGGRFDLTNVFAPAVSVITSVGLDHTATLGRTIPEIAWHKAGIIKPGVPVVSAVTEPAALDIIESEAASAGSRLVRVVPGETFEIAGFGSLGGTWREISGSRRGPLLTTALPGRFQATNAATAVAAARALRDRGFPVKVSAVRAGLAAARLPGRTEWMPTGDGPRVLLDGAHNPDKVAALTAELPLLIGRLMTGPVVLLGVLASKDAQAMIEPLLRDAAAVVLTSPHVLGKPSLPAADLAAIVQQARSRSPAPLGSEPVIVEPEPDAALDAALRLAADIGTDVVATGSLFLVGALRRHWYPDTAIVRQRTPWPTTD